MTKQHRTRSCKIRGLSILTRLFFALLGTTVICCGALSIVFYKSKKISIVKNTTERLRWELSQVASIFYFRFSDELVRDLRALSNSPVLEDLMTASGANAEVKARDLARQFRQTVDYHGDYDAISFFNWTGDRRVIITRDNVGVDKLDQVHRVLFAQLGNTTSKSVRLIGPWEDRNGGVVFTAGISIPDPDIGRFGGAIIIDCRLDNFFGRLRSIRVSGVHPLWILGPDGRLLSQPGKGSVLFDPRPLLPLAHQDVSNVVATKFGTVFYRDLYVTPDIPLIRLALSIPSFVFDREAREGLRVLFFVFAGVLIVVFLLSYFLSKYLSAPIIELAHAAKRLAMGDLTARVEAHAGGEVSLLIDSFNRMVDDLNKTTVSKDYLDGIIQCLTDSLFVISPSHNVSKVNTAACALLGYEEKEIVGQAAEIVIATIEPDIGADIDKMFNSGRHGCMERTFRKKDGKLVPVLFSAAVMHDAQGRASALICLVQDMTEWKRAAEELREAKEQADAANEAKSQFLANMSHEIRTPMNGVIGMTGLLLETDLTPEQKDYAQTVRTSAESLLHIINDILDFSKAEANKLELEIIDFDLRHTMREVSELLTEMAIAKEIEFSYIVHPQVPPWLRGDPGRLRQILINLGGNAIKFTSKGSVSIGVDVENQEDGDVTLRFVVKDTGIGIPKDRMALLFKSFSQTDTSMSRRYGGTGLGLAISKQLSSLMGGEIGVESNEGAGASFWFTAVLGKANPAQLMACISKLMDNGTVGPKTAQSLVTRHMLAEGGEANKKPFRILVAEDNSVNQKLMARLLEKEGFRADLVANGKEAIRALSMIPYDLVFMDVQMPEMDGLEATRIIRDLNSNVLKHDVRIVATTAHARREDQKICLEAGMDDYLCKPIKKDDLIKMVTQFVGTAAIGATSVCVEV